VGGESVSGGAEIVFEITGPTSAEATFSLNQYALDVIAGTGGTVSGAGTYGHGTEVTLLATADEGYSFAGWTVGEESVSGGAEIVVEITGPTSAEAAFVINQFTLIASAGEGGSIQGAGVFELNAVATLLATPKDGYAFDFWILDGTKISGNEELTVVMTDTRDATAYFKLQEQVANEDEPNEENQFTEPLEIAGVAIDGYLENAEVIFDVDGDGISELSQKVYTKEDGTFNFLLTEFELEEYDLNQNGKLDPTEGRIIISGGIDRATGSVFEGRLISDANATVVSPLSTLVTQLIEKGLDKSDALVKVGQAFDLDDSVDLTQFDPYAEAMEGSSSAVAVLVANHRMANIINQSEALIKKATPDFQSGQIGLDMMDAIAYQIMESSSEERIDLDKAVTDTFEQALAKLPNQDEFVQNATLLITAADKKHLEVQDSAMDAEQTMFALLEQQRKVDEQIIKAVKNSVGNETFLTSDLEKVLGDLDLSSGGANPLALLSKPLGENWHSSAWFGNFLDIGNQWIFHYPLGWLYIYKAENGYWIWDAQLEDWWWTVEKVQGRKVFPWIYSDESKGWVYLLVDENGVKAYDQKSSKWRRRK